MKTEARAVARRRTCRRPIPGALLLSMLTLIGGCVGPGVGDALRGGGTMVACIWAATACQHPGSAGCLEARALCEILSGTAHALGYKAIAGGAEATVAVVGHAASSASGEMRLLEDGASVTSGEEVEILVQPAQDSFVYAFRVDGVGRLELLHPTPEFENPVPAGTWRRLRFAVASSERGEDATVEHLHFVFAPSEEDELEKSMTDASAALPITSAPIAPVRSKSLITNATLVEPRRSMGEKSLREPGADWPLYRAPGPGSSLVVTRWLRVSG